MDDRRRVKDFILRNFLFTEDDAALADDASLIGDGVIDSTGILELVMFLEESLMITVAEGDMTPANFDSINSIDAFIARKRKT